MGASIATMGAWPHTETIGGNDVGAKQLPVSKDGCRRWVQLLRPYGFPAMPDATPTHRIARHMIVENIVATSRRCGPRMRRAVGAAGPPFRWYNVVVHIWAAFRGRRWKPSLMRLRWTTVYNGDESMTTAEAQRYVAHI